MVGFALMRRGGASGLCPYFTTKAFFLKKILKDPLCKRRTTDIT
jgi:hypothetical protein